MITYACTVWRPNVGKCGRPAQWNGRAYRCRFHEQKTKETR